MSDSLSSTSQRTPLRPGRARAPAGTLVSEARQARVLIVEDQPALARMLQGVLAEEGFEAAAAFDGPAALAAVEADVPDAIVLDVMLPGLDGLTVCRTLREAGHMMPVIMLTARDAVPDRVRGLDAGADDYLVKPFAFEELLARLRALLRREVGRGESIEVADLSLDPASHTVARAGRPIELTALEFRLLEFLMRHAGRVLTREQIVAHVWGYDAEHSSKPVDVYIHYLRRKVDSGSDRPLLRTVRAVGYKLQP